MGNTFNIQNKWKSLMLKTKTADSKIGTQSQCPKCGQKFTKDTSYEQFNNHLQNCLQNQQIIQQKHIVTETEVYVKKLEKGKYKWVKHLIKIDPNIYQFSPQMIRHRTFGEKLVWFYYKIDTHRIKWQYGAQNLVFKPQNIVIDSINTIMSVDLRKELKISVIDDKVSDAGGILREWSNLILKSLINEFGIFCKAESANTCYKLNKDAEMEDSFFTFLGGILAKIIFQKVTVDSHFDHTFLKMLMNKNVQLKDVATFDLQMYNSWMNILKTKNIQDFQLTFTLTQNGKNIDLIPNGGQTAVNELNKQYFVQKCIQFYCVRPYEKIMELIRAKIDEVIPLGELEIFQADELQIILNGVDYIELNDWKQGTVYKEGLHEKHKVVEWFWEVVGEMSQQQRSNLLKYVTGSSRLPIFGFKNLETNRGKSSSFTIQPMKFDKKNPFAKAHTCFNRLVLPLYPNIQATRLYLKALVKMDFDGVWGME